MRLAKSWVLSSLLLACAPSAFACVNTLPKSIGGPSISAVATTGSIGASSTNVGEGNLGVYYWDEASQSWIRDSVTMDHSLLNNYVPEPGDVLESSVRYGSPPPGGGGGGGTVPLSTPCTNLNPISVWAPRPSNGRFSTMVRVVSFYASTPGASSGVRKVYRRVNAAKADHPQNQTEANCNSDQPDRHAHAASDFAFWRISTFGTAAVRAGRNEVIEVTYDDGGTERYRWIAGTIPASTRPPEIYLAPIPGTLKCPN